MTTIRTPRFRPQGTRGSDGIPDYVVATAGSPFRFTPPPGYQLAVYHNGVRLRHVVEANRKEGWAVGFHYTRSGAIQTHDPDGVRQERLYHGVITFRLVPCG